MLLAMLQGISFATAPLLSVSPFKVFVFTSAVRQGWRQAVRLATVPLVADVPIIVLLWLILQQLPDWAVSGLRTLGGVFYLYLAYGLQRSLLRQPAPILAGGELRRTFWQAVVAVWMSPGPYINWSVIGIPALLRYAAESVGQAAMFLLGFYLVWVGGLAVQIVLVGQAGRMSNRGRGSLVTIGSLLLIGFGLYQIWTGVGAILGS